MKVLNKKDHPAKTRFLEVPCDPRSGIYEYMVLEWASSGHYVRLLSDQSGDVFWAYPVDYYVKEVLGEDSS